MSKRYSRAGIIPGSYTETQVARREAAMKTVRELLAKKPQSAFDLSAHLHAPSSTIYGYLRSMEAFGEVYQMDGVDSRGRKTWAVELRSIEPSADKAWAEHASRARIVKAEQVGIPRDPFVAALFGPAQHAA